MSLAFYTDKNPVTGRSVLWWVISFFTVIFIANFFFIYFALSSWTGLSTENAYEKGVHFNETLAKGEAQKKLGWRSSVAIAANNQLKVKLVDRTGAPLTGLNVYANLVRPVIEGSDQKIRLSEAGRGFYQAPVTFSHFGRWQVEVVVEGRYRLSHNIEVAR